VRSISFFERRFFIFDDVEVIKPNEKRTGIIIICLPLEPSPGVSLEAYAVSAPGRMWLPSGHGVRATMELTKRHINALHKHPSVSSTSTTPYHNMLYGTHIHAI